VPEVQIPEPGTGDINPNTRTVKVGLRQIPEPLDKGNEQRTCEIPEPEKPQIPEPANYGLGDDADILSNHTRLWRLEVYEDRHGKRRARRVLRFVARPEPREELGQVTEELAEGLKERPGKGRWQLSRAESEQLKLAAEYIAGGFRRNKRLRRNRSILRRPERADNSTAERGDMPKPQDDALWDNVPDVLM